MGRGRPAPAAGKLVDRPPGFVNRIDNGEGAVTAITFSALLERHRGEAYGVFAPPTVEQLGLERAQARDVFAAAFERRQRALAELEAADTQLHAAVRQCRAVGARVSQLAVLAEVSRPTIYAWLRGCRA